jgi:hypothetical protein
MSDDQLRSIYYDTKTGFRGESDLYNKAKELGYKVTHSITKEWLKKQSTQQVHSVPKLVKHYYPIKSPYKDYIFNVDLCDVSQQAHLNDQVNYLLICIDIYTRFAWVIPLKNKTANTVVNAFSNLLDNIQKDNHTIPKKISCDQGSEFISSLWNNLMKKHGIEMSYCVVGNHHVMGIIDSFTKSLRRYIAKYCTTAGTQRYIDVLPDLISNYNNSFHSSIGGKPNAIKPNDKFIENRIKDREDLANGSVAQFKLNDQVRYITNKMLFDKGAKANWSNSTHKITGISDNGRLYTLDNGKKYKYYQLYHIPITESVVIEPKGDNKQNDEKKDTDKIILNKLPKKQRLAILKEGINPAVDITNEKSRVRIPRLFYNKLTGKYET